MRILKSFLFHGFILDSRVAIDKSDVILILDPLERFWLFLSDNSRNLFSVSNVLKWQYDIPLFPSQCAQYPVSSFNMEIMSLSSLKFSEIISLIVFSLLLSYFCLLEISIIQILNLLDESYVLNLFSLSNFPSIFFLYLLRSHLIF